MTNIPVVYKNEITFKMEYYGMSKRYSIKFSCVFLSTAAVFV